MTGRRRLTALRVVATAALVALAPWTMPPSAALLAQTTHQQLYLTVLDGDNAPVVDLRPHEIVVTENGERCEVLYLSRSSRLADVSILVDTSGAIAPITTHVRQALSVFVDALADDARMSLTTFGDLPVRRVPPTTRVTALHEAIDRLFPTADAIPRLQDALVEVAGDLARRRPTRPTLVVLTSDQAGSTFANNSPSSTVRPVDEIIGTLQGMGAPVHVVALRTRESFESTLESSAARPESTTGIVGRGAFERLDQQGGGRFAGDPTTRASLVARGTQDWMTLLETASQRTGGRLFNLFASAGLEKPMLEIANEVASQYILTYARPLASVNADAVDVQIGIARPDVTIRATPLR